MSLISDALRKADSSGGNPPPSSLSSRSLWIYRILLVGSVLVVLTALGVVTKVPKGLSPSRSEAVKPLRPTSPKPLGSLLLRQAEGGPHLEGIVRGGNGNSLALINNRILKEGDAIQGSRIVRVENDHVQVEENGAIRTLKLTD